MLYRIMTRGSPRRLAARLALMAMIMMFAGPLISQLQHLPPVDTQHHDDAMSMSHADMTSANGQHTQHDTNVFHWFDQCGYCSLWQHFPGALADISSAVRDSARPLQTVPPFIQRLSAGVPVFPNALSRAPPALS